MLDRILGDEVDHRDRAHLLLAPGAGDALFELGRIPRQVEIDDQLAICRFSPVAPASVVRNSPAGRVLPEARDLAAPALLRHDPVCQA